MPGFKKGFLIFRVKINDFWITILSYGKLDHGKSEKSLSRDSRIQDPKPLKMVKISKSLFRDFPIGIDQIDHEESANRGPETLGSSLRVP